MPGVEAPEGVLTALSVMKNHDPGLRVGRRRRELEWGMGGRGIAGQ